ncbi:MAG: OmpA family protein, partial [Alphaproteobacteria bacterium]
PPEFLATLSPEGLVQLRGRATDARERAVLTSYAEARFGVENVHAAMRLDPDLPAGWAARALAALEALDQLANGVAIVQPDLVEVRGASGHADASAEISRLLSDKLGEAENFRVDVRYEEKLDPVAAMPTPEECAASIRGVLDEQKITFAPGSSTIDLSSARTLDRIAEILKSCPDVAMEIAGYTDSQGREEMNKALSQRRAEAVLTALLARRVLTSNLKAHGYGEENPIADNGTEQGREANRRIEFHLIGEEPAKGAAAGEEPPAASEDAAGAPEGAGQDATAEASGGEAAAAAEAPADGEAPAEETVEPAPPRVVDPELKGIRPKPRPAQDG